MKKIAILLFCFTCCLLIKGQPQRQKGYPTTDTDTRLLQKFRNPPKGYGNVPFYWWNGDSLNQDRLKEQLDILSSSAIDGFSVSYMHYNPKLDRDETKNGYGLFGNTDPGRPQVFSDEWWNVWNWFAGECAKKGIGIGLDDYTVGWTGNGYYPDELLNIPSFRDYQGNLNFKKLKTTDTPIQEKLPSDVLTVVAWPGGIDLTEHIHNGVLNWQPPINEEYNVFIINTSPGYLLHPEHGKEIIRVYFDRFEKQMGKSAKESMNYFFQDEMYYPLQIGTWGNDFKEEFHKRKGYDILPYLPALAEYIGPVTPKIRLDYCDVLIDLAEERYMKPIYDWHANRGLIYGSDNLGRGLEPLSYVDYFRINSWYTAPGNDAPAKGSSFLQTKVSSSIAHLYERPRTWLEAFHSMGWGSSGEWLTQQIDHHIIAGGNLICMHGLYYSTHGGWWEWAPPCFHFRMPYWPHMKKWLEYTERMSFLLSQGKHVCDIAILYPTESMQAYPGASEKIAFEQALKLSNAGLDYDFIDYTSLGKAIVENGYLQTAGEKYKVIILADIKALHHSSLLKIREHFRNGGIVLATGSLPYASSRAGENDPEVENIIKEIFGENINQPQTNPNGGTGLYLSPENIPEKIKELIVPDFDPGMDGGKVLHRHIGNRDVYMVMDVAKNTECFFRSTGKVELWDALSGEATPYPVIKQTDEGTWLRLEKDAANSYLFVFSPGQPVHSEEKALQTAQKGTITIPVEGEWDVELLPTMQNKWGDYRFPAFDGYIGAEARSFRYMPADKNNKSWIQTAFDDTNWHEGIYGYGPQAVLYRICSGTPLDDAIAAVKENRVSGEVVDFSWQYGVWDNPGSQGYHGLKGKVSDGFFILSSGQHQIYKTFIYAPRTDLYRIETEGVTPDMLWIGNKKGEEKIHLKKGWHELIIAYGNTTKQEFKMEPEILDLRKRGAVVLFPASSPTVIKPDPYDPVISTKWNMGEHLYFDPWSGKNTNWNFRFTSAPGMKEIDFVVAGKDLKIWVDSKELPKRNIQLQKIQPDGSHCYHVILDKPQKAPATIAFSVNSLPGFQGSAIICEPVKIKTETGLLSAGDWSETGALRYYSGGMFYRKTIHIDHLSKTDKAFLDLGNVVATCEVKINGKEAGILMSPPYRFDIADLIHPGENHIEVLVYSTLSNHYQTIPTPFRGDPVAGLIGPVAIDLIIK